MLNLLAEAQTWPPVKRGETLAAATIVHVSGSAPRPMGTSMLVSSSGEVLGSLSGGCVEGAVVQAAGEAIETGQGQRARFSYTDQDAFAAGLTCGGTIEVHIQPLPAHDLARDSTGDLTGDLIGGLTDGLAGRVLPADERITVLVSRLGTGGAASGPSLLLAGGPDALGGVGSLAALADMLADGSGIRPGTDVVRALSKRLQTLAAGGGASLLDLGGDGEWCSLPATTLLVESRLPAPRFLIFGANDFGEAMIGQAALLGYGVTLCDPRPAFATQARFAPAHQVVGAWPHRYLQQEVDAGRVDARTVVCVLCHDPKFDIPLLEVALSLDVAYVGALGSRLSHAKRIDSLLEAGVAPEQLATLHSPIGLDLGAGTPAEVAVSIAAGVIAFRNGRAAHAQLSRGSGAIHATPEPVSVLPDPTHELTHA
ncbi:XdhC/CoxI family protein [Arthrobacter sp. H35-D1]|uniref:XdhC family protein n=1 Tax=Arthrobacter sp. H35-D1 TaxID=3046202 RepID=UPI0024BB9749|nr:XdhC/CoxI family protein [Arthrobacter sp. H35-D1]MDJ0315438.1 XdhC family protein [Arthrobacter sp. H35-D1]